MEGSDCASKMYQESEHEFLDDMCSVLSSVGNNLNEFVEDCSVDAPKSIIEPTLNHRFQTLQSESRNLQNNVNLLLEPLAASKKGDSDKIEKLQSRCDELHAQWQEQESQLGRAQAEIFRLRNQVMHQSTFCASLGAVLGNLVWRASRFPQVIDIWLSGNKVGEFLCIVNGTFVSFINTYGAVFPPISSDESQFVMGLCGIVTNMSASPQGRQFLVTNPNGKDLLQKLVNLMPSVPLPSGSSLKRLMLMILYNVSINQTGLLYLLELRVGEVLSQCLEQSAPAELKLLCLRLLQSITFELSDVQTINDILKSISAKRIEELAESEPEKTSAIAKEVLNNLKKSRIPFEQNGDGYKKTSSNY